MQAVDLSTRVEAPDSSRLPGVVLERDEQGRPSHGGQAEDEGAHELEPSVGARARRSLRASIHFCLDRGRLLVRHGVGLRFAGFCLVGLNGLVINTGLFAAGTEGLDLPYAVAGFVATQCATLCNYVLLEAWVFRGRAYARNGAVRISSFFLLTNAAVALSAPLLFGFSGLGLSYLLANLLSVGTLTLLRFVVADAWIWRAARVPEERLDEASIGSFLKALPQPLPSTSTATIEVGFENREDVRVGPRRWQR
jgi:putative flippase GtrA